MNIKNGNKDVILVSAPVQIPHFGTLLEHGDLLGHRDWDLDLGLTISTHFPVDTLYWLLYFVKAPGI